MSRDFHSLELLADAWQDEQHARAELTEADDDPDDTPPPAAPAIVPLPVLWEVPGWEEAA